MTPEEVLRIELGKYLSALHHLEVSFLKDDIPENVYNERKNNLEPLIQQFEDAILTLRRFKRFIYHKNSNNDPDKARIT